MAEPIKISTTKYANKGKVDIDGNIWDVVLPGAGTELRFSQASRACKLYAARLELYDKKIESGNATEEDLNRYEEYSNIFEENERVVFDIFLKSFNDSTEDNSQVRRWVEETPTVFIIMAFEEVKNAGAEKASGGDTEKTA